MENKSIKIGLIILVLCLGYVKSQAQDVIFQLYGKSICNDSISLIDTYRLQSSSGEKFDVFEKQYLYLPDTGTFLLETSHVHPHDSITIRISNFGLNSDTIHLLQVSEVIWIHIYRKEDWWCCGTICEGYYVDYYNNGHKYMEGLFRKGKPRGSFIYYNTDGTISSIEYYNKRGKLLKTEWPNGFRSK